MARLVFDNILKNAGNYTKDHVWLTLDENSESWLVVVEDNGPGIPRERQDEVFVPFSRLDSSRSAQPVVLDWGLPLQTLRRSS